MLLNRRWFLIITIVSLLLAFQNCQSSDSFQASSSSDSGISKSAGNGTGYDGKPTIFYNYSPDFQCQGNDSFYAAIQIQNNIVGYIQNTQASCGFQSGFLDKNQLVFSPFQNHLVGYQDKIFEYSATSFSKTPDTLAEAWCFNDEKEINFEIIQKYSRSSQTSRSEIYSSMSLSSQPLEVQGVSHIIDAQQFRFVTSSYELVIDRTQINSQTGLYSGVIQLIQNNKAFTQHLNCRLGGYLKEELINANPISLETYTSAKTKNTISSTVSTIGLITPALETNLQLSANEFLNPSRAFYLDEKNVSSAFSYFRTYPNSSTQIDLITQVRSSWVTPQKTMEFSGQIIIDVAPTLSGSWAHLLIDLAPSSRLTSSQVSHFVNASQALDLKMEALHSVKALSDKGEFLGLNSAAELIKIKASEATGLQSQHVCEQAQNIQNLWQSATDSQRIIFYSFKDQSLLLWQLKTSDMSCSLINDLPIQVWDSLISARHIIPAPDLLSVVVVTTNTTSGYYDKVLWVPLNGRASIDITPLNIMTVPNGTEVFYSFDSRMIYFSQQPFHQIIKTYWSWPVPFSFSW